MRRLVAITVAGVLTCNLGHPRCLRAQRADSSVVVRRDSVAVRLVDVEVKAAIQALSPYLDRPVIFGAIGDGRVTIETPAPIPLRDIVSLMRGILASHNLELVTDSTLYRVRMRDAQPAGTPGAVAPGRSAAPPELFVIRLRHARAPDVAATLNALYGRASAPGEIGASPPTLSELLRQGQVPSVGSVPAAPAGTASAPRTTTLSGDATIVPDSRANSLLVRGTRADFELLTAAVREIDVRPLQTLIEVLIAEVRRDRSLDLGVDAAMPPRNVGRDGSVRGSLTGGGGGVGDFVLKLMNLGSVNIEATLRAAQARGDASIVSRPVVLTSNNKRAEIVVGTQRPFVQVVRALPTDSPVRDQVVQYRDVGTRLFVLPTISEDGYVMLEVSQEVNAATNETAFNAPVISTRSVQTHLLIKDGQTIALGGLTDRQRDESRGGIPVLSGIPLIGGLFGRYSKRTTETELFLFITPRIVRDDDGANEVTDPLLKKARKISP